jgi:hypothetical protein
VPDTVCAVLERMMAKDPDDRYNNIDELFEDLEMVKMGQDPKSPRLDAGRSTILRVYRIERQRRDRTETEVDRLRRHNLWMRMAVGIMGLIVVVLAVIIFFLFLKVRYTGG